MRNLIRSKIRNLNKGIDPEHCSLNDLGHIPTYTQDTVIKANLNKDQQKLFSRNLIRNMLENDNLSPEDRRNNIRQSSEKFINEIN